MKNLPESEKCSKIVGQNALTLPTNHATLVYKSGCVPGGERCLSRRDRAAQKVRLREDKKRTLNQKRRDRIMKIAIINENSQAPRTASSKQP